MQINNLPATSINEPKGSSAVATAPPPPKVAPKPAVPSPAKAPEAAKEVKDAAASTSGTKTEITDVQPTGDTNAEGDATFTLKVNGKEIKATQAQIVAMAQKAQGAEAAMKRTAEIEKLAQNMLDNFDNDAYGLLVQRHGKEKAKQIVIQMTRNLIAEEDKTPEQKELDVLRIKNKENEAASERAKKEQEEAQNNIKKQQLYKTLLTDIDRELNETVLPKDKLTLTRVLNFLSAGKKANGQAWTVKDAVKAVEIEDMSHATYYGRQYVAGKLPSEKFRAILGEDVFKKLSTEQINLLKKADKIAKTTPATENASADAPAPRPRTLSKTKGAEGMSEREYRKKFGSLGGI